MNGRPVIAVVGATGAVGEAMLEILHERLGNDCVVHPLASERSLGRKVRFGPSLSALTVNVQGTWNSASPHSTQLSAR